MKADGTIDSEVWLKEIANRKIPLPLIEKSIQWVNHAGQGLTTFYGKPCIEQGADIAEILLGLHLDEEAIAASIIMPTIQHANTSIETIQKELGEPVAKIAASEKQMNFLQTGRNTLHKNRDQIQLDRLRKTLLAMVSDIRVVLIKLAEQLCILRGIKKVNTVERKRIAQITLDIYAQLANRLGVGQLKWELEDLAFHYTNPDTYKIIATYLSERRTDREKRIHSVIQQLENQFAAATIDASISGRAKHIYSIFLKMQKKHLDYKNIYDASAVRILVPTEEACYTALSIVHHLWEHIPEEFDDYIANPKQNGYRSIHTAVIGPENKPLEIQIRTRTMHETAEHGVAAHWLYKENKAHASGYENKILYLRQLLAWHKEVAKNDNKPENVLDDRVYVFTPNGDVIDLPIGATPLDFAYHIHSELGHRCRGAKVNGHIVQLTHALQTGDRVDIITAVNGTPSRDWLNKEFGYLKTARARAKIAQWFRQLDVTQYIESGKHNLERELQRAGIHHPDLQKVAERLNFKNTEALLTSVGHGTIRPAQITHLLQEQNKPAAPLLPSIKKSASISTAGLQIAGIDDLLTRIARCCKPIPSDTILGYITQGRGVSIHRTDCRNLAALTRNHDERVLQVSWDHAALGNYYVDLQITAIGSAVLKEMTSLLANHKIDLIALNSTTNKKNNTIFITLTIQIHDVSQLTKIMRELQQLSPVIDIKRSNK